MESKLIGKVNEEEKNEIMVIYERRLGIEELMYTFKSNLLSEEESEKLLSKMSLEAGKGKIDSERWWQRMFQKYGWEAEEGRNWRIDFDTCDIYLE